MHFIHGMFLAACVTVLFSLWHNRSGLTNGDRRFYIGVAVIFAVFILWTWLSAIRASQLAPHHIVQSINGHVIADFWTTNPVYLTYEGSPVEQRFWPDALKSGARIQTNYYWTVWSIWR